MFCLKCAVFRFGSFAFIENIIKMEAKSKQDMHSDELSESDYDSMDDSYGTLPYVPEIP